MKKFTTIKTLLVGLCTMGAMSAWADEATLTPTQITIIDAGDADAVKYDATATEWRVSQSGVSGKALKNYGLPVAIMKFDTSETLKGQNLQKATLTFNSVCTVSGKNSNVQVAVIGTNWDATTATWNNTNTAEIIDIDAIDTGSGGTNVKTSTVTLTRDVTSYLEKDEDKVIGFSIYTYTAREQKITDVKLLLEYVDATASAEYTVLYVDENNNELKSVKLTGTTGNAATVKEELKASFKNEEGTKKYIFVSDDAEGKTVEGDGSTVVTLTYREAAIWNYTIMAKNDGNELKAIKEGTGFEADAMSVPYYLYINVDNKLYKKGAGQSTKNEFNYKFTLSENNKVESLDYTAIDDVDLVFLSEGEDIEGLTRCNSSNTGIRSSNSASAYASSDTKITTLEPGKYKLHAVIYDASKTPNSHWIFKAGDKQIANLNCTTVNIQELASPEFEVYYETDIIMAKMGGNTMGLDAIYIEKTGDVELPANVTVEVSDAGWATLFTDFALNFEGTGLTAYTATLSESTVTLTEVTSVTAGTGVVLKGDAKTYEIPVIDGSETAKGDLKGNATTATEANGTQYVLMMNGSNAQFTKATSGSIAAGKAYLEKAGAEARILNVVFAGETTGIKAIETVQADGNIYNMAGQRVAAPQKGLFIMNGKKVIIK